jgi:O-antigen/teichoic acid export membrane protein
MGYKTKAIKSVSWMGALNISTRIISLVKFMIIARLLVPADLGAFGLVVFIVGVAEVFSELGIQTFLIQYKKNINKFIDSAWILQIIRGVGLFIIVALLAFPASLFFRQSVLFQLILLGALVPLIKSFENTYVINFQKELHFHKQFFYNLIIVVSDFLVSVTLAIILHSVLALVLGLVLSSLVGIIYSWVVLKTRPKRSFNREKIGEILHYGKWININSVIYYTITQMDTLFIGRLLGTSVLGLYQVSQNFSYTPMQEVADVVGQVNFPVYSKIAGDIQRFKKAYLKVVSALFLVELVIGIILFVFPEN